MRRRSLLCGLLAWPALADKEFMGRWRSVETTKGGIGAVYEIRKNGTVRYSSAAIVEQGYERNGNQLTILGSTPSSVGMGWHTDGRLQLNYGQNRIEDYVRVGAVVDAAEPLLGEWKGRRSMGAVELPVMLQFRTTKQMLMVIELKTYVGRHAAGRITLAGLAGRRVFEDAAEGQIVIQVDGGDRHPFIRF